MNKEPTEAQIKEFWEWCGFSYLPYEQRVDPNKAYYGNWGWQRPSKESFLVKLPPIDLNNLFKYAVPPPMDVHFKQETNYPLYKDKRMAIHCWLYHKGKMFNGWHSHNPALALFWAIYPIIKGETDDKPTD